MTGLGLLTSTVRLRVRGSAGADVVWERYAEPAHWSQWSPQIALVDASGPRLAPGLTGQLRSRAVAGARIDVGFDVLAVDEAARTWSWVVHVGPTDLVLHHAVEVDGSGPGGTTTTLDISGLTALVVPYRPLARLALTRLVRP